MRTSRAWVVVACTLIAALTPAAVATPATVSDRPETFSSTAKPSFLPSLAAVAEPAPERVGGEIARGGQLGGTALSGPSRGSAQSTAPTPSSITPSSFSSPSRNYPGITSPFTPPDPIGDVGPSHYVQAINTHYAIYLKSDAGGTPVVGPSLLNTLFVGVTGICETENHGDPVVIYDQLAGRWIIAQFARGGGPGQHRICLAISLSSNPTGSYNRYTFPTTNFPDYFKIGVWPDAYYIAWNEGNVGIAALQRPAMLTGSGAQILTTTVPGHLGANMMLPADADGPTPPPAGAPGLVYHHVDGAIAGGGDRLHLRTVVPTFGVSPSITVSAPTAIPVSSFDGNFCGFTEFAECVPQPGTTQKLDPIMEWPMWRFQYRNLGSHEALVGNFLTDVGGDRAGIRWFELRKAGSGPWSLFQEGTHSPDATGRWIGSIAMDGEGNIALGYSASDATATFPSLWYAGRVADDAPGALPRGEVQLVAGTSSQVGSFRWGDYASMNVDPVDDCTFWFTGQYSLPGAGQETRIGAFSLCGTVTVTKAGAGSGTVTTPDGKISCGADCVEGYGADPIPALTATAGPGSFFKGWSGGGCSGTGTCTPVKAANVTATFEPVGTKSVKLKAKKQVPTGKKVRLKASVTPCAGHEGDLIEFQRKTKKGWKTFANTASDTSCFAKATRKMKRTTRFRALSPQQDADHGSATSNTARVRAI